MHSNIRSFSTHEPATFAGDTALTPASCDPQVGLGSMALELGLGVTGLTMRRLREAAVGECGDMHARPSLPLTLRAW